MRRTEDARTIRITAQEVMIANDKQANEKMEEDQENQESRSGQVNTTDEGSEDQRIIDVIREIGAETIEYAEADDEHCNEDDEEGAIQEAIQATRVSNQDTSGIEDISDYISKVLSTQMN
jgi:hypothetical protein